MSLEIKVPTVGESITEVTIASWTKKDGDYVEMDEVIAELESDKATFELNAEEAGVLRIKADEGDTIEIGAIIGEIDTEAAGQGGGEAPQQEAAPAAAKQEAASSGDSGGGQAVATGEVIEMKIPTVGESITEVSIAEWLKEDGAFVELDEVIAEIESDKATFELTAESAGILHIKAEAGETLEIGALACTIEAAEQGSQAQAPAKEQPEAEGSRSTETDRETPSVGGNGQQTYATGHAAPAAAKILAEKGIDPKDVKGSGRDGRITKEDAEKAQKQAAPEAKAAPQPAKEAPKPQAAPQPQSGSEGNRVQRREKMTSLRKTVSRRLVAAKNETAMLTTFNEVDMKPVMDMRKKYKEAFKEKYEVNLGFMSFFTKAACMALQEWPAVNAMIDGEEIIYNDYCDVSIAVSSPRGLVVPVIRNAESLSFDQVEKEVVRLAKKARDGKLSIEEMTGGTFTITNGGIFGSMLSTPIINQPQSAILGMHNIVERPVAVNGQVEIRPVMYVALSYDHRIIDGRESVSFLYRVKELIEDPSRLLLGI